MPRAPTPLAMNPLIPYPNDLAAQVERALAEDIGSGDLTAALIPAARTGRASLLTRESALLCGVPYANAVFAQFDTSWPVAPQATPPHPALAHHPPFPPPC